QRAEEAVAGEVQRVHDVRLQVAHQALHAAGVDQVAGLAQRLRTLDVVDAGALDLGRAKGDDVAVDPAANGVLDPAPRVDIRRVREIYDSHASILGHFVRIAAATAARGRDSGFSGRFEGVQLGQQRAGAAYAGAELAGAPGELPV